MFAEGMITVKHDILRRSRESHEPCCFSRSNSNCNVTGFDLECITTTLGIGKSESVVNVGPKSARLGFSLGAFSTEGLGHFHFDTG